MKIFKSLPFWVLLIITLSCSNQKSNPKSKMTNIKLKIPSKFYHDLKKKRPKINNFLSFFGVNDSKKKIDKDVLPPPNLLVTAVRVNISSPDMNRIFWIWEGCPFGDNCVNPDPVPPIEFTVPSGAGRIFQVLVFAEPIDNTVDSEPVFYGELTKDLFSENEVVNINATEIFVGSVSENRVMGKYYASDGRNLTGKVDFYAYLKAGSPAMLVEQSEIFDGYFSFFAISDVDFRYEMPGFSPPFVLFDRLGINTPFEFNSALMDIHIPDYYSSYGPAGSPKLEDEVDRHIVGHFGSVPAGKTICFDTVSSASIYGRYLDSSLTNILTWNGSYSASSTTVHPISGGVADVANCSSSEFIDSLIYHQENFESWSSRVVGFEGPFKVLPSTGGGPNLLRSEELAPTNGNSSTYANFKVTWDFLPNMFTTNGLVGVTLFLKHFPGSTDPRKDADVYRVNDGYNCNSLEDAGFTPLITTSSSSTKEYTLQDYPITNATESFFILCPKGAQKYFNSAIGENVKFSGSGGGPFYFGNSRDGDVSLAIDIGDVANTAYVDGNGTSRIFSAMRKVDDPSGNPTLVLSGNSPTASEFTVSDEIMWVVMGLGVADDCGVGIEVGQFGFAEITSISGNSITLNNQIPIGGTVSNYTNSPTQGVSFCRVQIIRVPNFANLTLDATAIDRNIKALPFDFLNGVNGVVAFRVANNLTISGGFNLNILTSDGINQSGYAGGGTSPLQGDGYGGQGSSPVDDVANFNGGGGIINSPVWQGGGGGAGIANGGGGGRHDGATQTASNNGGLYNLQQPPQGSPPLIVMGGGGGGAGLGTGANGGGIIFVQAKNLIGNVIVDANGGSAIAVTSTAINVLAPGGGGGGTIIFDVRDIQNASIVTLSANGGTGADANITAATGSEYVSSGGGGGGGLIVANICTSNINVNVSANGGANGVTTYAGTPPILVDGTSGQNGIVTGNIISSNSPTCY